LSFNYQTKGIRVLPDFEKGFEESDRQLGEGLERYSLKMNIKSEKASIQINLYECDVYLLSKDSSDQFISNFFIPERITNIFKIGNLLLDT
jgi:hypothetical protein